MEFLLIVILALSVVGVLVVADWTRGGRGLFIAAIAAAAMLVVLSWWLWERDPKDEAPLIANLMAAVIPVSGVAIVVFRSRGWYLFARVGVSAALYILLLFASALFGTYVLGDIIPLRR